MPAPARRQSQDGSRIVFAETLASSPEAFQLDGFYDPVWSPDGTKVLLGHELMGTDGSFRKGWR